MFQNRFVKSYLDIFLDKKIYTKFQLILEQLKYRTL